MRVLAVLLALLLALVLFGLAAAGWLLGTTEGARRLLDFVREQAHLDLQVEALEGRILDRLELRGVTLHTAEMDLQLARVEWIWQPRVLLQKRLRVDSLVASDLVLVLHPTAAPKDDEPFAIPQLPLIIDVGHAQLDRLRIEQAQARPLALRDLAADELQWAGSEARVGRLVLTHAQTGPIEVRGRAQLASQHIDFEQFEIRTHGETPTVIGLAGRLGLEQQASALALTWRDLRWPLTQPPQINSAKGRADIGGTWKQLAFDTEFVLGEQAAVQAKGLYSDAQLETNIRWQNLQWPLSGAARIASARGTLQFHGKPEDYRYTLDATLTAKQQQGRAQAQGRGGLDHVTLERLLFAVADARAEGSGTVRWQPSLSVAGDVQLSQLDPGLVAPEWPGRINGRVQAHSDLSGEQPRTQFEIALSESELRGYPLKLDANGELRGEQLRANQLVLVSGSTRLEASGQLTPPFDARAKLDSANLAALYPKLGGRAQLDLQIGGTLQSPRIKGGGSAAELRFQDLQLAKLSLQADVDLDRPSQLRVAAQGLRGPATLDSLELEVRGRAAEHRIDISAVGESGRYALGFSGAYDRQRRSWNGQLGSGHFDPPDLAAWTLEEAANLRVSAQAIRLEPTCWHAESARACMQGTRTDTRLRGAFRLERLSLAYFESFLPDSLRLHGDVDGTGVIEWDQDQLSEARVELSTTPIELRLDGETALKTQAGSLNIGQQAGAIQARLALPLAAGHVNLDAELAPPRAEAPDRALQAHLDLRIEDLSFLRLLSPEVEKISGVLQGNMNWSGSLRRPVAQGAIRLQDAELALRTPGIELTQMRAELTSADAGRLNLSAQAHSDKGEIQVQGQVDLAAEEPKAELAIKGENFQAANLSEVRAWISPDLKVSADRGGIEVRGDVVVPRADIRPANLDGGVAPSSDEIIVHPQKERAADAAMRLLADVNIVLGEKVRVDGLGLTTRVTGSVRAVEQSGRPQSARGELRLVDGRYKAYGQELEIETGRLLFNGGPLTEPAVEIRAKRKPREDIEVGVYVRGTLERPEFSLFSTPTLPREQQLSWLVLGRSLEESGSGDERAMMANAALALGLSGASSLAGNLGGGLRLDELSIGSDAGEPAEQARLTVGKYLSPRIFVSYGVGLFQPGQVFKLLYDLGHGFKLSTESGVHAGGDLLYSIERH
jgi:translocation and assembly module TamB